MLSLLLLRLLLQLLVVVVLSLQGDAKQWRRGQGHSSAPIFGEELFQSRRLLCLGLVSYRMEDGWMDGWSNIWYMA